MPTATSFIANRIYFSSEGATRSSRPAVKVALLGVIIGVMVMIITLCIVMGFRQTISDKVAAFTSHIQVVNFDNNNTYEMQPVAFNDTLLGKLRRIEHVTAATPFATKPGIIKTDSAFQAIVLKGGEMQAFLPNLVSGAMPVQKNEALISRSLSLSLSLSVGDAILCYFVEDNVRVRKLLISGIYETGFLDYDKMFVLTDMSVIQQLNGWNPNQASGIEVRVDDLKNLQSVDEAVYFATCNRLDEDGNALYVQNLMQQNYTIFAWLDLLDMNVIIIIILMLCVSGFNMISGLIILILDGIQLIGTLKALGADNRFVRTVFLKQASWLIGKGILWGNILGLGLAALQYFTHLAPLDAATYYVPYVPVTFPWLAIILLNLGTALVSLLILLLPSAIISKISPAQVMRFE